MLQHVNYANYNNGPAYKGPALKQNAIQIILQLLLFSNYLVNIHKSFYNIFEKR